MDGYASKTPIGGTQLIEHTMFREYDIRGRVNDRELNPTTVELIGKGFGTLLHRRGIRDVAVGYDSRESSPGFRDAMIAGLVATGRNVVDVGMVLSPVLYWAQHALGVRGGVMITGSHNPPEWNGLKLSTEPSTTLLRPDIEKLLAIVSEGDFVSGTGAARPQSIRQAYLDDVLGRVKLASRMHITIDAGNATPGAWAPDVYQAAGCDVDCLYCDIDPRFPNHFPNPSELENMKDLQRRVVEEGTELGLAFDGDGDRLGVVDGTGKVVYADRILMLLARQVLARHPGAKIVFDVKCSQALVDDIKAHGGVPIMWITGHSYMRTKVRDERAALKNLVYQGRNEHLPCGN
jgi:phosphomannomutase/phosphoglucomutase